jgi:DNA ligase 1
MASPAKKRKLNKDNKQPVIPSRGLEYFFAKQKQIGDTSKATKEDESPTNATTGDQEMTDEALAMKLQAEWDAEIAAERRNVPAAPQATETASSHTDVVPADESANGNSQKTEVAKSSPAPAPLPAEPKGKGTLSLQSVAASVDTVSESIPMDQSPLTFDPSAYVPQLKEHWASEDGSASYALLTRCEYSEHICCHLDIFDSRVNVFESKVSR